MFLRCSSGGIGCPGCRVLAAKSDIRSPPSKRTLSAPSFLSTFSGPWIGQYGPNGAGPLSLRTMKAIVAARLGGPEVLQLVDLENPQPRAGEVVIDVVRAGVNFADLLSIAGRYAAAPPPPFTPGLEVSGTEAGTGRPVIAVVRTGGFAEKVVADPRFVFEAAGLDLE